MATHRIEVTRDDFDRLVNVLKDQLACPTASRERFHALTTALAHCEVTDTVMISADVVTIGSHVKVTDVDTGDKDEYELVVPFDADIVRGKLSVLSTVGTAILGRRVKDVAQGQIPAGTFRARIDEVKQPSFATVDR
jgi:transcription elongation GreA/GreB family factor